MLAFGAAKKFGYPFTPSPAPLHLFLASHPPKTFIITKSHIDCFPPPLDSTRPCIRFSLLYFSCTDSLVSVSSLVVVTFLRH